MTAPGGSDSVPTAVVVGVGDELLLGRTVDTNGAWLAAELSDLGFRVRRRWVVGDVRAEIQEALSQGMELADVVLLTGGLGPTRDDLTRPAVAEALGAPLDEDPGLLAALQANFRARGHGKLPPTTRLMAQVPRGARVLENPQGSAPGLALEAGGGKICVLLPGPPREMKGIFSKGVVHLLGEAFHDLLSPAHHRTIHTTGIPESLLAQRMDPLLPSDPGPVSVAFLPDRTGVRIRLTTRGKDKEEAEALFDKLEETVAGVLEPYRYSSERGDLAEAVGRALRSSDVNLAVAESCTGGLIAKRLTDIPGSSRYFPGGVVAYSNEVKVRELGVPQGMLEEEGAVSRSVAEAMARGVAQRFGTRAGIGVTGVAGPGGGTDEKPVGTVWYAVRLNERTRVLKRQFPGDRESVRERATQAALALLLRMLEGKGS
ncbi:MAG: competence/damage-inducible protein A [Longimicrobiales bacterium]